MLARHPQLCTVAKASHFTTAIAVDAIAHVAAAVAIKQRHDADQLSTNMPQHAESEHVHHLSLCRTISQSSCLRKMAQQGAGSLLCS